jgi:nucleoside-diphosphate-sugar epimerase
MRRILITGATGFLGTHLTRRLAGSGSEVFAVRRSEQQDRDINLHGDGVMPVYTDGTFESAERTIRELHPDTVFHLASWAGDATTAADSRRVIEANFVVGVQWLEALRHSGHECVFVNAGSFWQFRPGDPPIPNSLYAAAKQAFQAMLPWYMANSAIRSTTLVLYDLYGPFDWRGKLWQRLLEATPGEVIALSEGNQLIELVYVSDAVRALIHAAQLLHLSTALESHYAVDSGNRQPLRKLVQEFLQCAGKHLRVDWGRLPQTPLTILTPWTGPRLPGWAPETSLQAGVSETLATLCRTVPSGVTK